MTGLMDLKELMLTDLMQKAINFNDVIIVSIKRYDYRTHFWYMRKDDAMNTIKNSNLNEKSGLL